MKAPSSSGGSRLCSDITQFKNAALFSSTSFTTNRGGKYYDPRLKVKEFQDKDKHRLSMRCTVL